MCIFDVNYKCASPGSTYPIHFIISSYVRRVKSSITWSDKGMIASLLLVVANPIV